MKILAIGAHFDDVELGCGGALAAHAARGDEVYVFVATVSGFTNQYDQSVRSSEIARAEAEEAMRILGVKQMFCGDFKTLQVEFVDELNIQILRLVEQLGIDQVYTHWTGDIHHDHQAVARASLHSCRHVPRLLLYRSNWYHSTVDFRGNFYVDITENWDAKEKAIRAHKSEMNRTGAKWISFFRNEAENAGQRIGVLMAEVFEIVKFLD
jgi:LmbE family N-acetylglucosaminyl deacetylase